MTNVYRGERRPEEEDELRQEKRALTGEGRKRLGPKKKRSKNCKTKTARETVWGGVTVPLI